MKRNVVKIAAVAAGFLTVFSMTGCKVRYEKEEPVSENETIAPPSTSVRVRYYNENLTPFFEKCEKEYEAAHTDTDIILDLQGTDDYIVKIDSDSANPNTCPDVYMINNSDLGTAYLGGLTYKNSYDIYNSENYCETAINACSYAGNLIAYPLFYNTSFLLYNKDYIKEKDVVTFETLKNYSQSVDFTNKEDSKIQAVFGTDVSDLFLNYGYLGNGMDIGGPAGDDANKLDLENDLVLEGVTEYKALIDYFHLTAKSDAADCLDKFYSGKILSTVANSENIRQIIEKNINFGVAAFPDYDISIKTTPLSITTALVVNPYSANTEKASDFAKFATYDEAYSLYGTSYCFTSRRGADYPVKTLQNMYGSYEKSVSKNKLLYGNQVYPLLEIEIHNIVAGEDTKEELKKVSEYMKTQLQ